MKFLNKIFGDPNQKELNKIKPLLREVNQKEADFKDK